MVPPGEMETRVLPELFSYRLKTGLTRLYRFPERPLAHIFRPSHFTHTTTLLQPWLYGFCLPYCNRPNLLSKRVECADNVCKQVPTMVDHFAQREKKKLALQRVLSGQEKRGFVAVGHLSAVQAFFGSRVLGCYGHTVYFQKVTF